MRKFPLWDRLRRRPAVAFSHELISRYHSHDIPRQSAALSYYILFALFANCLMRGVRRAYGLEGGVGLFVYYLRLLLYTVSLLLVLAVALVLTTVGQRLLTYFTAHLSFSPYLIELWHYLRFVVLAVFLFAALGLLYALAQDRPQAAEGIVPGVLISLAAWMLLSLGFSFYVENFASYSVIYGTLGAVIVLLIWLYFSSITLLLGAELNAMLLARKNFPKEGI